MRTGVGMGGDRPVVTRTATGRGVTAGGPHARPHTSPRHPPARISTRRYLHPHPHPHPPHPTLHSSVTRTALGTIKVSRNGLLSHRTVPEYKGSSQEGQGDGLCDYR
ncbi:hypothetical protein E2C01_072885 [Portunus trituberculatus]|uniref:Uncharacterized protein n=1 Tax=Portunus trituberculatus TaxID=210409 RepID=A0A5B7I199_PORTR|nr:hypothetical protein [Portunus trituberculatus]